MAEFTKVAHDDMPAGEYAILEALGHRTLVGRVAEVERFGTKMLQIEPLFVSSETGALMLGPVLIGGSSIYQFTPCTAIVALRSAPRQRYSLPSSIEGTLHEAFPLVAHAPAFLVDDEEDHGHG